MKARRGWGRRFAAANAQYCDNAPPAACGRRCWQPPVAGCDSAMQSPGKAFARPQAAFSSPYRFREAQPSEGISGKGDRKLKYKGKLSARLRGWVILLSSQLVVIATSSILPLITNSEFRQSTTGTISIIASCLMIAVFLFSAPMIFINYCKIEESSVFIRYGLLGITFGYGTIKEVKLSAYTHHIWPTNNNDILIYYDKNNKRRCASFTPKENFEIVIEKIRQNCGGATDAPP
ncbi:MAG: hypothetical protein LBL83_01620 [Clostridiales bacterium]|nr:hypothetical protein [Clostridiales bacterium]